MNLLKKNQIIIYVIVLMLMTAGYLNYTTNNAGEAKSLETSIQMASSDDTQTSNIGDATLVSSNDIKPEEQAENEATNEATNANTNTNTNTQNQSNTSIGEAVLTNSNVNSSEYFTKSKLERDTMYSQMIASYEKILNSAQAPELQKQTATQEITKINETKNGIMICENLIKTKGFEQSVIFVNGQSISVIIGAEEMKPDEIAQIQNILVRELKAEIEHIHISTK